MVRRRYDLNQHRAPNSVVLTQNRVREAIQQTNILRASGFPFRKLKQKTGTKFRAAFSVQKVRFGCKQIVIV